MGSADVAFHLYSFFCQSISYCLVNSLSGDLGSAIQNCLNPPAERDLAGRLFNIQGQISNGLSASARLQLFLQSYKSSQGRKKK